MFNVFAWNNVDGYQFKTFGETNQVLDFCGNFGEPKYTPCGASFAEAVTKARKNKESGCVVTVLLITEGEAMIPSTSLNEWTASYAYSNE